MKKNGFTLIEIMVIVAIVGIMGASVGFAVSGRGVKQSEDYVRARIPVLCRNMTDRVYERGIAHGINIEGNNLVIYKNTGATFAAIATLPLPGNPAVKVTMCDLGTNTAPGNAVSDIYVDENSTLKVGRPSTPGAFIADLGVTQERWIYIQTKRNGAVAQFMRIRFRNLPQPIAMTIIVTETWIGGTWKRQK